VGELVYHLLEIQQVVEETCGKTRRYQKLPEAEAENRVGVFHAQSPRYRCANSYLSDFAADFRLYARFPNNG
jgi:hypothetical protein